jgi:hypothetical protein
MAYDPATMLPAIPALVPDQGGRQGRLLRRRRTRREGPGFAPELEEVEDYDPTPVERPDPNQPLIEAMDRLRAVEQSAAEPAREATTAVRVRAVKAYQDHSSGWYRPDPG